MAALLIAVQTLLDEEGRRVSRRVVHDNRLDAVGVLGSDGIEVVHAAQTQPSAQCLHLGLVQLAVGQYLVPVVHVQQSGLLRDGQVGRLSGDALIEGGSDEGGDGVDGGREADHHLTQDTGRGSAEEGQQEEEEDGGEKKGGQEALHLGREEMVERGGGVLEERRWRMVCARCAADYRY